MNLNDALKYQQRDRLTVAQIHPSLRFTRLGAVLREHATAPDEVGALAHSALTSDHSQPLELMPLHLLKDKMQEEPDHPLAKEFNWVRVPDGVQLEQRLMEWANKTKTLPTDDPHRLLNPILHHKEPVPKGAGTAWEVRSMKEAFPDKTVEELQHAVERLRRKQAREDSHNYEQERNYGISAETRHEWLADPDHVYGREERFNLHEDVFPHWGSVR